MKNMYKYGIGNTKLRQVGNMPVYLKLENENFLGSIKSRTAYWMIKALEGSNIRKLVESTSGNLGLALGYFCREKEIEFLCLVDPSIAKIKLEKLKDFGIKYCIVDKIGEMDYRTSRIHEAKRLRDEEGYIWINQYDNINGVLAHYNTTGPEIYTQTDGKITHLVCPVGSGGTISGTALYLKEKNSNIHIIAVEPLGSTIFNSLDGKYINVGAGLKGKPGNIKRYRKYIDDYFVISDDESIDRSNYLYKKYGFEVGVTTGMAFSAAEKILAQKKDSYIVVIAPDGRQSYEEYLG